jgi:uncharacterized protein involved in exopolysaccharide biosynthesis
MNEGISLQDIFEEVIKSRMVLSCIFIAAILAAGLFYIAAPKYYTAKATIIPISNQSGGLASLLSSSSLGMLAGQGMGSDIFYVALKSRTLAENVLNKFPATELIINITAEKMQPTDKETAVERLRNKILKVYPGRNGSIMVEAALRDGKKAAYLVNQYLVELALFLNNKAMNTNFSVIDPAQQPLEQSAPRLSIVIVSAFCLAFILSAAYLSAAIYANR